MLLTTAIIWVCSHFYDILQQRATRENIVKHCGCKTVTTSQYVIHKNINYLRVSALCSSIYLVLNECTVGCIQFR